MMHLLFVNLYNGYEHKYYIDDSYVLDKYDTK